VKKIKQLFNQKLLKNRMKLSYKQRWAIFKSYYTLKIVQKHAKILLN
jgi:hypothetical protein